MKNKLAIQTHAESAAGRQLRLAIFPQFARWHATRQECQGMLRVRRVYRRGLVLPARIERQTAPVPSLRNGVTPHI